MKCKFCNTIFIPKKKNQIFCSRFCLCKQNSKNLQGKTPKNKRYLTNIKIGKLLVISEFKTESGFYCDCICDCGKNIRIKTSRLTGNSPTQSCGCLRSEIVSQIKFTGFEDISGTYWGNIVQGAKVRNIEFAITKEYAWQLFLQQNKKCRLSNLELTFAPSKNKICQTASLDRIDSSKGYIEGNVQWVHKDINKMKNDLSNDDFIKYCTLVSKTFEN